MPAVTLSPHQAKHKYRPTLRASLAVPLFKANRDMRKAEARLIVLNAETAVEIVRTKFERRASKSEGDRPDIDAQGERVVAIKKSLK